jgi:hypothetical protein
MLGRIAGKTLAEPVRSELEGASALARAHERLGRARAAERSLDAYEGHALPVAVLAGIAVALAWKR